MGFASRKPELVLYIMNGLASQEALLAKLGKHRTGKSCLYIRRLADVDAKVLAKLIANCARETRKDHFSLCS